MVSGDTIAIDASDDAIHSDSTVTIDGGTLAVATGDGAVHAEAPSISSTQKWVASAFTAQSGVVQIVSGQTVLATSASTKAFASIVCSSADLTGTAYDVYLNGQATSAATGPYCVGGSLTGATMVATVTVDSAPATGGMGGHR